MQGAANHRCPRRVLRGDRPRRLHPVHADAAARGAALARPGLGWRDAALGPPFRDVVDARGHDARHPRRADQDRASSPRSQAGIGMYAVGALVLLFPAIMVTFDARELWRRVEWADGEMPPAAAARAAFARVAAMTAAPSTAAQVGLLSCEACQLLSRPASAAEPGFCRRCGEAARVPPPRLDPDDLGARHRRGDLLHPRKRAACAQYDDAGNLRGRHDPGRRRVPLHVGLVAARARRADRERDDPAREDRRARLSADHGAARLGHEQPRANAPVSDGGVHRPLVDARRVRRHLHRCPGAAAAADVGRARCRRPVLRRRRRADDARRRGLRPAPDLGLRQPAHRLRHG